MAVICVALSSWGQALVLQTDFGTADGAVAAMKGVAYGIDPRLPIFDLTHEIPPYDIWEAAYRLHQTALYWPAGTVFVSVVDPGVGSDRKSIILKTKSGHYFVSPDNGTLTLIAEYLGIEEVREIDEAINRRKESGHSYTFHGRDVYVFTGARLATGKISFREVGPVLNKNIISIPYAHARREGRTLWGNIPVLDVRYGNVWSNVNEALLKEAGITYGDQLRITIKQGDQIAYEGTIPLVRTFAEVPVGKPLAYLNSLLQFSLAINQGSFSEVHQIKSGADWTIQIQKVQ